MIILRYLSNYYKNTKFYSIFLTKPLQKNNWQEENYSYSHLQKGENYHEKFEKYPGRNLIWNIEKKIILDFVDKKEIDKQLDFAAGTGRIAQLLEKQVKKQYLLDSSSKMLSYAKKILKDSVIINNDFTKIDDHQKFDLITAFRFFPNAEPKLREKAMKFISKSLSKNGLLILNNHRNFWSLPYFFKRLTFRSDGFGMTHKEVEILVRSNGLKIYKYKSTGLITEKEKSRFILWWLVSIIENFFFKINSNHKLGYNVLYLIGK